MTFPRAERDLLIFLASSNTDPSAPVLLTCVCVGERETHTERVWRYYIILKPICKYIMTLSGFLKTKTETILKI